MVEKNSIKPRRGSLSALLAILSMILLFRYCSFSSSSVSTHPGVSRKNCTITHSNDRKYGSWPVCLEALRGGDSLVYSFGLGSDVSFDHYLINTYPGLTVHGFDPTLSKERIELITRQASSPNFMFHPYGLASQDTLLNFYRSKNPKIGSMVSESGLEGYEIEPAVKAPVFRLPTLMRMLNHTYIDLVKIDIEGAEFDLWETASDIYRLPVTQVLIETHERLFKNPQKKEKLVAMFKEAGFVCHEFGQELVFLRV